MLDERIQTTKIKLEEYIVRAFAVLLKDLGALSALPPGAYIIDLFDCSPDERSYKRVDRCAYLEDNLILLSSSRSIDNI